MRCTGGAAIGAREAVAAVDGHPVAKRGDLLGEASPGLAAQSFGPLDERRAGGLEERLDLGVVELPRELHGREASAMKDLVRIRVADAAEQTRVGERALQRVALAHERGAEAGEVGVQDLETAGIVRAQGLPRRARSGARRASWSSPR